MGLFLFIFVLFQTNITIYITNICEKMSIQFFGVVIQTHNLQYTSLLSCNPQTRAPSQQRVPISYISETKLPSDESSLDEMSIHRTFLTSLQQLLCCVVVDNIQIAQRQNHHHQHQQQQRSNKRPEDAIDKEKPQLSILRRSQVGRSYLMLKPVRTG